MWYRPLSKYQSWCYALLTSKYINSSGKSWSKWSKWGCEEFLQGKTVWEMMSHKISKICPFPLTYQSSNLKRLGRKLPASLQSDHWDGTGQGKSCPAEISLVVKRQEKTAPASSSVPFFWLFLAVKLGVTCP